MENDILMRVIFPEMEEGSGGGMSGSGKYGMTG
jgi:hypothetical protein